MHEFKKQLLLTQFVDQAIADKNATEIYAKLPRNDQRIMTNKVRQIRGDSCLAQYRDELGNLVRLCNDGIVRQYLPGDKIPKN
jgi:hypothetical protein